MQRIAALSAHLAPNPTATKTTASQQLFGQVGVQSDDDIVVVGAVRTAIGKANKGAFKDETPDDLLYAALAGLLSRTGVEPERVNDLVVGNCLMQGSYAGPSRAAMFRAGLPVECSLHTLNRQCSSGLQAVASIASAIKCGYIQVGIAAGVESMSAGGKADVGTGAPFNKEKTKALKIAQDTLIPMGITSEIVAARYGVTRKEQDAFAEQSHAKAVAAQRGGLFAREIVPVTLRDGRVVTVDEGPRADTTLEGLAKLKPAFKPDGTTTAGNSSQVSDGAAAVLLMKRKTARELKLPVRGVFRGFRVEGVQPDEMGVGPAVAIPSLLKDVGVPLSAVDSFEINEAFASQAVYCVKKLGIDAAKVNKTGGAIAIGHPLACTGNRQVATLLAQLERDHKRIGVISMCIGTGMGAAALFEAER